MKKNTLLKRFEKNRKELRGVARSVVEHLAGVRPLPSWQVQGDKIRVCWTSGRGRFTTNLDHEATICAALDLLKIKYKTGNDAPRGGAAGKFVQILTKFE